VLQPLIEVVLLIAAGLLLYRFHRQMLAGLKRFDARNRARRVQEIHDRGDALAHFRHTLARAEEQVEPVSEIVVTDERTATDVTRYLFEGEQFQSRADAERVRADKVRALARKFYMELPAALAARRGDGRLN